MINNFFLKLNLYGGIKEVTAPGVGRLSEFPEMVGTARSLINDGLPLEDYSYERVYNVFLLFSSSWTVYIFNPEWIVLFEK